MNRLRWRPARPWAWVAALLLAGPAMVAVGGGVELGGDWRTADRSSAGIAPDPAATPEAVVLVYAARAFSWRGLFAVHTWIATKPAGAARYTVHQVVGWRRYQGLPVVVSRPDIPDRLWFGQRPVAVQVLRGGPAERAIPAIEQAVARYPYPDRYMLWPGPNSNTFTAWVMRSVPELDAALPPTAIGKDFLPGGALLARAPSGSGWQLSLLGIAGVTVGAREGVELNVAGAVFGVDLLRPAIKLPGIGRLPAGG